MIYTIDSSYNISEIGGKASALARVSKISNAIYIPSWFVVGVEGASEQEISHALSNFEDDVLFAVRSSAVDEDGVNHSYAGQFESYLNITKPQVFEYIKKVQASAQNDRVKAYRHERGIKHDLPPAVLVQEMIEADFAGVAFGANPVTGNTKECVINAVRGLGDKLVDGSVNADTFTVTGNIVKYNYVSGECILFGEKNCFEIAELCKQASQFFGHLQDIEWAYGDDRLYLLQSRPITSLRKFSEKSGYISIWDNSNIAESYNGVTTPLTFSFIRMAYEHVYRGMSRMLGVSENKIAESDYIYTHMLGLHDGQVYYNLLSWYKLVAILPGYKTNAKFMEQMMGVKEGLSPEVRKLLPPPSEASIYTAIRKLWKHYRNNDRNVEKFFELLQCTIQPRDLGELSLFELAQYYRELEGKLLKKWNAPVINDFFSMIFYGLLKSTSKKWCGLEDENKFNGLLRDTGDIISTEPARLVRELAEMVKGNEELVKSLLTDEVFAIQQKMTDFHNGQADEINQTDEKENINEREKIVQKSRKFLDKFGDRCINELKLESETLNDNPLPFYRAVGNFAVKLNSGTVQEVKDNFNEEEIINKAGFKKPLFKWILKNARRTIRNRENLRFERTRVFGTVRRIFRQMGMHLTSFGVINKADDVFYLECNEILGFIEGTATTFNLRGLVEIRKKEYENYGSLSQNRFETYECVGLSKRHITQVEKTEANNNILQGLGCCPGIVRGLARVINDPKDAVIHPGEILVAKRTDPGWIMLFPVAAGVLVEYGSLLSHTAIVVREMGIPAVVSVKGLLSFVETGDLLELDGEKGTVVIIGKHSTISNRNGRHT